MDDSSILSKPTISEEESGWTAYFDDFIAQQADNNHRKSDTCISDTSFCTPSLVSDAASTVPWKKNNRNHPMGTCSPVDYQSTDTIIIHKKLSFKKTRAKEISHHDDSLEDTASSPVNSPKVGSLKQVNINPGKGEDNYDFSMVRSDDYDIASVTQTNETIQMNIEKTIDAEYSELKNKGLCLVPMSMLDHYIG